MSAPFRVVTTFREQLHSLGWISALWLGGSVATGDHVPGVSDLDLVALVDGPLERDREATLVALHRELDAGAAAGADLGCVYVDDRVVLADHWLHPTWTHGRLVRRVLSGISRAELVRYGTAGFGPSPQKVLRPVTDDDVRLAAHAELTGYSATAAARPWWWLDPVIADLGLTSMARGRHALATGHLLTKSAAVEVADAPPWLIADLRARRRGATVTSPRWRTGFHAWRDARRTTAAARAGRPFGSAGSAPGPS